MCEKKIDNFVCILLA